MKEGTATEAYWLGYMIAVLREENRLLRLQERDVIVDLTGVEELVDQLPFLGIPTCVVRAM